MRKPFVLKKKKRRRKKMTKSEKSDVKRFVRRLKLRLQRQRIQKKMLNRMWNTTQKPKERKRYKRSEIRKHSS